MRDVEGYFNSQAAACADETVSDLWRQLQDFHARRLWHQLTGVLRELVKHLKGVHALLPLYNEAIAEFENKLNPLSLVEICRPIAASLSEAGEIKEADEFLEKLGVKVRHNTESFALTKILQGQIYVERQKDMDKTKVVLNEVEHLLDDIVGIGIVQKEFYLLQSEYFKILGNHAEYYKASLRYLGVSDLTERSDEENVSLASHLALAAILGKNVFNFGELLAHPILKYLSQAPEQWLIELLQAFNAGHVAKFTALKQHWGKQPDLLANEPILYEKISLLSLMEMTFTRSATHRQITFQEIADQTNLSHDKIELLVMKALSRGLIKGQIDQVGETIHIHWVQPRVLDCLQLQTLQGKIDKWLEAIASVEGLIETNAKEILTY